MISRIENTLTRDQKFRSESCRSPFSAWNIVRLRIAHLPSRRAPLCTRGAWPRAVQPGARAMGGRGHIRRSHAPSIQSSGSSFTRFARFSNTYYAVASWLRFDAAKCEWRTSDRKRPARWTHAHPHRRSRSSGEVILWFLRSKQMLFIQWKNN